MSDDKFLQKSILKTELESEKETENKIYRTYKKNFVSPLDEMKADAKEANRRLRKKWGQPVEVRPNLEVMSKQAERVNEMLKRGNKRAHIASYLNISLAHVGRLCREYGLPREE